jgi:hypothetical protein
MIDEPWKLEELEPSEKLDRRLRQRMRKAQGRTPARRAARLAKPSESARGAAPFLPFERAVYVVLVAVYAIYTGARAVQVFQDARAFEVLPSIASGAVQGGIVHGAAALTCAGRHGAQQSERRSDDVGG